MNKKPYYANFALCLINMMATRYYECNNNIIINDKTAFYLQLVSTFWTSWLYQDLSSSATQHSSVLDPFSSVFHCCARLGLGSRMEQGNNLVLTDLYQGFFQLFAQGGGQNEIVWIIGGSSTYLCAKHVTNWGVRGTPGNFDFLLDTIWWNLGLFTIYCH